MNSLMKDILTIAVLGVVVSIGSACNLIGSQRVISDVESRDGLSS
jgi:hypothetical protein